MNIFYLFEFILLISLAYVCFIDDDCNSHGFCNDGTCSCDIDWNVKQDCLFILKTVQSITNSNTCPLRSIHLVDVIKGFANIAGMMKECWNFLWGVISGGTRAPFNIIFIVQSPKFLKSMFFVTSGTSVIGINYHLCRSGSSGICLWPANRAIVVRF